MIGNKEILGFQGEYRFLSNFWPCEIWFNGIEFPSVKHAYVASKSEYEEDWFEVSKIVKPGDVKRFGRKLDLRPDWDEVKLELMHDFVLQKFLEEPLRTKLLNTDDAYLEETNSWNDVFWGVNREGIGYNHLGKILMQVRENIKYE